MSYQITLHRRFGCKQKSTQVTDWVLLVLGSLAVSETLGQIPSPFGYGHGTEQQMRLDFGGSTLCRIGFEEERKAL